MNAHRSPKIWAEQSRRLMELRPEVEEISEDLKAPGYLFAKQIEIIDGLEKILLYLQRAGDEYVRSHDAVDSEHKTGRSLVDTIDENNMAWVRDFMAGGEGYRSNYEDNLTKSKGAMRLEVFSPCCRVPDNYIGRRVWTVLKGETLRIECGKETIGCYGVQTDYLSALLWES